MDGGCMNRTIVAAAVCIGALCTLASAEYAAYMTVEGQTQGNIPGSCAMTTHPGDILVYGYEHTVTTLPDATTCLATGHPNHFPFIVIKGVDKATVPLFAAFNNNELLTTVRLRCWRGVASGQEQQYYTVTLVNARIAGIRHEMLYMGPGATLNLVPQLERVSFTYERIVESWMVDGGMEEAGGWSAQCKKSDAYSDLNLDGVVNILDFAIMADQWLMQN
jgi:type VI secretion system Hcp family effector